MAGNETQERLTAARRIITDPRLRTLMGKKKMLVEDGNVYGDRISEEEVNRVVDQIFTAETIRKNILMALQGKPLSVRSLSERTGVKPDIVFKHLLTLQQKGEVEVANVDEEWPIYRSVKKE